MKKWSKFEIDFIKDRYFVDGCKKCCESLKRSRASVQRKANNLGLKVSKERIKKNQQENIQKYRPDLCGIDAAKIIACDTPESVYFLGFLWADGYLLRYAKQHRISIEIIREDGDVLNAIFSKFGKWSICYRTRPKRRPQTLFVCCNKQLFEWLESLGYTEKSGISAQKVLDHIPKNLQHFWFQGLFDGDGCFYIHKKQHLYQTSIASCYDQNWDFVINLYRKLGVKISIKRYDYGKNKSSVIRTSSVRDFKLIGNYLYKEGCIGLQRKYLKFKEIFNV